LRPWTLRTGGLEDAILTAFYADERDADTIVAFVLAGVTEA